MPTSPRVHGQEGAPQHILMPSTPSLQSDGRSPSHGDRHDSHSPKPSDVHDRSETTTPAASQPRDGNAIRLIAVDEVTLSRLQTCESHLLKELGKISAARATITRLSSEKHHQIAACLYTNGYMKESRHALDQQIHTLLAPSVALPGAALPEEYWAHEQEYVSLDQKASGLTAATIDPSVDSLHETYSVYHQDHLDLDRQLRELQDTEQHMLRVQGRLQEKDDAVQANVRELLSMLKQLGLSGRTEDNLDGVSHHGSQHSLSVRLSEPEVHPLAQAYYDACGYVNILHERLMKARAEYDEERGYRALRVDRDEVLSVSDSCFERSYEEQFWQAKQSLDAAVVDEGLAREAYAAISADLDAQPDNTTLREERSIKMAENWATGTNPLEEYAEFPQEFQANPSERPLNRSRHSVQDLMHLPDAKVQPEAWPIALEAQEQNLRRMQLQFASSAPDISSPDPGKSSLRTGRRQSFTTLTALAREDVRPTRHDSGQVDMKLDVRLPGAPT
ncbi:hypothetical protein CLAFUW4_05683 [Fulvia fulva]|nr:hypothetical protein CLAFUR4_05677 [Fulvia fulva]WPV15313.1 hypothetical protein CLAFUW4_05683 [Fulvia fulva]WPV29921.1 hypothetical protein CLAFUW7_05682 [Fulvia fulva]